MVRRAATFHVIILSVLGAGEESSGAGSGFFRSGGDMGASIDISCQGSKFNVDDDQRPSFPFSSFNDHTLCAWPIID